jgi:hypothetical protein
MAMDGMLVGVIVNSFLEEDHYDMWENCSWNKHLNSLSF